jgi:hypothetical protein
MTTPKRPFVYLLVAIATFASTFSIGYRISELMVRVPQITVTKTLVSPSNNCILIDAFYESKEYLWDCKEPRP